MIYQNPDWPIQSFESKENNTKKGMKKIVYLLLCSFPLSYLEEWKQSLAEGQNATSASSLAVDREKGTWRMKA